MRRITRIAIVMVAALAAQQALAPMTGFAQVDPCEPVPIPELCPEEEEPLPVPEPDPSPKPSPKPGGGGGGGKGDQGNKGGSDTTDKTKKGSKKKKNKQEAETPELQPFFLGGPQNTARLLKILSGVTAHGVSMREALLSVAGPFPVAGLAWWTNDWHACRDGCTRFHKGLDIFAETGTPLVAAADGVVTQKGIGELAGLYVEIEDAAGVEYFYAHMSRWGDVQVGQQVAVGDVLGYVGNTGNAIFTPPHVHFEYQPNGEPVPPKPFVDRWLELAERRALQLVLEVTGEPPVSLPELDTFRLTRSFDLAGAGETAESASARFLLLAGLQPVASSLEMARTTLDRMAWEIDWNEQVDSELAALLEQYQETVARQQVMATPFFGQPGTVTTDGAELPEHAHEVGD